MSRSGWTYLTSLMFLLFAAWVGNWFHTRHQLLERREALEALLEEQDYEIHSLSLQVIADRYTARAQSHLSTTEAGAYFQEQKHAMARASSADRLLQARQKAWATQRELDEVNRRLGDR